MSEDYTAKQRRQFLCDVLLGAADSGIYYWVKKARRYMWDEEPGGEFPWSSWVTAAYVEVIPEDSDITTWMPIDIEVIDRGIQRILEPTFRINESLRRDIAYGNLMNDAGEIDADGADCVVQAGLFGEIVYG